MNLPLRLSLRYLFSRKSHNVINIISGISVAGMAVGTAALIVVLSVFNGFNSIVDGTLSDTDPDLKVVPASGKVFVPDSAAFRWAYSEKAVLSMSSVLEDQVFISYGASETVGKIKGGDAVFEEESPLKAHMLDGAFSLHKGELPRAVVGAEIASRMGINPRFVTPIELYYPDRTAKFSPMNPSASLSKVKIMPSGIVSVNQDVDTKYIFVPLETARELLGYEEEVSAVEIRFAEGLSPREKTAFVEGLSERLGDGFWIMDRYRQNDAVYKMMRYEKAAIYLILIFIIIIIASNVFSSLTMLIMEKKEDIFTLRSMGADDGTIRRIFRLEGWLVSLLGMIIGLVVGILIVWLQQRFGIVKMNGNFIIDAYPAVLKFTDVLLAAGGVALVGYFIALIPSTNKKLIQQI